MGPGEGQGRIRGGCRGESGRPGEGHVRVSGGSGVQLRVREGSRGGSGDQWAGGSEEGHGRVQGRVGEWSREGSGMGQWRIRGSRGWSMGRVRGVSTIG